MQRGSSSVVFLIFMCLAVLGLSVILDHSRTVFNYDLDLQQAVTDAARSAAFTIDPLSQAHADPMIDPDKAHAVFRKVLAKNLSLSETTLIPETKSSLTEAPTYILVVFNGENDYGLLQGVKYPSGTSFTGSLPQDFSIVGIDILNGDNGGMVTNLDHPGCIAIVNCNMEPVFSDSNTGTRWASAKVVKK